MNQLLQAAVAVEDITPPVGCSLAAYQRTERSQGILDRLELGIVVLRSGATPFAWITIDNIAFLVPETDPIRRAVADILGTSPSNVSVSFSHTHSGPKVDSRYLNFVTEKSCAAVVRCLRSFQPVSLGWGVFSADANSNRRYTGTSKAMIPLGADGSVDRRVGVLRIDDATGRPLAVLVRYSAHGTVLRAENLLISADWPGAVRASLQPVLGCPVLITNGSAGDSNPRWRGTRSDLERIADAIAQPVFAAFDSIRMSPDVRIGVKSQVVTIDCEDLPNAAEAHQLAEEVEREWEAPTDRWQAEVSRRWQEGQRGVQLPVEVQVVQIGDGLIAGIPMETFTKQALDFAASFAGRPAFLNGYTNGWIGYVPGDEDLAQGGYEVRWAPVVYGWQSGWLTPLRPGAGKRLVEAVIGMANLLSS
jgi:hypothetical protein